MLDSDSSIVVELNQNGGNNLEVDTSVMEQNLQNILNEKFGGKRRKSSKKSSKKVSKKSSKKVSKKSSKRMTGGSWKGKKSSKGGKRKVSKKASKKTSKKVSKKSSKRMSGGKREINPYMKARSALVKAIFAEAKKNDIKLSVALSAGVIKKIEADVIKEHKLDKDSDKVKILEKGLDHFKKNILKYLK